MRRGSMVVVALLLVLTGPGLALALSWTDQFPETPAIDIYYDIRPTILDRPNVMTESQASVAIAALDLWSSVGDVNFIRNPWASDYAILNLGAMEIDGPWGIVGQGGYRYVEGDGVRHITSGVVAMDASEPWDLEVAGASVPGTVNFYTVAAHEVGHALGLNHTPNPEDIMYAYYTGAKAAPSPTDVAAVQSLYGGGTYASHSEPISTLTAVPEPSSLLMLLIGAGLTLAMRWGRLPSSAPRCTHEKTV